jgi:hypothetical protein
MKRYDKQDLECISHMFKITELMRSYKGAEDDIADIKEYMQAITEQVQMALKAEQVHFITIRREHNRWSTDKKVYYYVSIKTEIHIDGIKQNASTPYIAEYEKLRKKFGGMEKKEAAAYAEQLRKKYNFKIMKEGF